MKTCRFSEEQMVKILRETGKRPVARVANGTQVDERPREPTHARIANSEATPPSSKRPPASSIW